MCLPGLEELHLFIHIQDSPPGLDLEAPWAAPLLPFARLAQLRAFELVLRLDQYTNRCNDKLDLAAQRVMQYVLGPRYDNARLRRAEARANEGMRRAWPKGGRVGFDQPVGSTPAAETPTTVVSAPVDRLVETHVPASRVAATRASAAARTTAQADKTPKAKRAHPTQDVSQPRSNTFRTGETRPPPKQVTFARASRAPNELPAPRGKKPFKEKRSPAATPPNYIPNWCGSRGMHGPPLPGDPGTDEKAAPEAPVVGRMSDETRVAAGLPRAAVGGGQQGPVPAKRSVSDKGEGMARRTKKAGRAPKKRAPPATLVKS